MQFLEALRLRSKLFFLFLLISFGLVVVGVMGAFNIEAMKKNIDSVYFGSLVPVTELNEILQTYHNGLANSIYASRESQMSPSELSSKIQNSIFKINNLWDSYEHHFKRDDEQQYVEYTGHEIEVVNDYFRRLSTAAMNGSDMSRVSLNTLEHKITHVHNVIQKLISYEVKIAQYERRKFLDTYNMSMAQLGFILFSILIGVMLISYYVFRSIQKDQSRLEITTSRLKKANKKLENASYTDSLTSLNNRRYFNIVYDRELKRAKREKSYITFMMLDIDFFKQYNDTYGHIEGDFALKSVAKVLTDTLKRPTDFVFRLGGEEFGVLLTHTDESSSAKLARDICTAVKAREIKHENSKVCEYVTISIGVVCCIADEALNEEILISRSDEMLYEAKKNGRDGYVITSNISECQTQATEEATA
ncbi:MAG: diguanylate cyclase [Sulfurimonas sp.]|nr:diguanylate cyclase [Sulfurimonas sp.]MBU3938235.1 diguanylate cyclase [bacterium]MBU4023735.1 diguanylate cyclase [bacterium]MBU4058955.1 diguanylate cyclase [bacterium]MBU4110092.1 diguanylate cyclase [bacterium]